VRTPSRIPLDEALGAHDGGQLGPEHLQGDLAVVFQVLGQIDRCHAALAKLADNAVAALEGGVQASRCIGVLVTCVCRIVGGG